MVSFSPRLSRPDDDGDDDDNDDGDDDNDDNDKDDYDDNDDETDDDDNERWCMVMIMQPRTETKMLSEVEM